jgi:hypothetical protein
MKRLCLGGLIVTRYVERRVLVARVALEKKLAPRKLSSEQQKPFSLGRRLESGRTRG